jgi:hypothetical protein
MIPRDNEDNINKNTQIKPMIQNQKPMKIQKTEKMKEDNYNFIYSVKPNNLYLQA